MHIFQYHAEQLYELATAWTTNMHIECPGPSWLGNVVFGGVIYYVDTLYRWVAFKIAPFCHCMIKRLSNVGFLSITQYDMLMIEDES